MNICIVSPSFGHGGANIIASKIGKELSKTHNVFYYGFKTEANYMDLPEDKLFFYKKKHNSYIQKIRKGFETLYNSGEFTPSKYVKAEIAYLYELIAKEKIDFVILNTFVSTTYFARALKLVFPELPVIAWMHEAVDYSFNVLAKKYLTSFVEAIKVTDGIVCLTERDYQKFIQYNQNVKIIYNPVLFNNKEIASLDVEKVSFVSRLDINVKGLDILVDVANDLNTKWPIVIAANHRDNQLELFQELLKKNTKNNIEYVGPKKGNSLIEHYLDSSIFLSTSRVEALPLVLIEAMSCGLPIVSFDHSGANEILREGKYGVLVSNLDSKKMVEELEKLMSDKVLREKYQQLSLKRAEDFKLEKILPKWLMLIEETTSVVK
ncbi:glycosyltransferase [Enterococcus faecalis]|uniref:Glycosyltransferase n=3 Tax=Enterococcus faecalis TaxID=1351 RepID=A0A4U3MRP5_ENTFL|nr:glycosyltransferase [Enterococcus faecalis]EGO8664341.1 glycosyltransferase [Enterococcus faecalis]EKZ0157467.1 glycosyltransferase [Enterococcus faecalis]MDK0487343.1 glycosyltransferase [Enterococcus faecalis]MDK0508786.1 glycosyltransferase [Enterococcus faecalis]NSO87832.1 glycosyltransferase [Enterococcus faecalis]